MSNGYPTAGRIPTLAERDVIPADELDDYERTMAFVVKYSAGNSVSDARRYVDGEPYALSYRKAWTNAPRLKATLLDASYALTAYQGKRGWFSPADHEWIDLVLGFDSGYWAFHAGHTANAISAGIRLEAMEAIRDGCEDLLTEAFVVRFIRGVRDGEITDDIWSAMSIRLGSVKGTIGFAYFVCVMWTHHRMMWAMGVPAMGATEWGQMVDAYRSGAQDPQAATQDYIWSTLRDSRE